jgi:ankyrin repeat protein
MVFLFITGSIYSQISDPDTAVYDTTDYVPSFYKGAVDYNLMIAASKGYTTEINRLIMNGADIFAETDQGVTPLIFAISNNHTRVAKLLIDFGSDVNKVTIKGDSPLLIAVKNQNEELAEALIRAGSNIDITDRYDASPLHYASVYGYLQLVDILLYYEAPIDKKTIDGSTPLLASIWAGYADIADLLIQNGANKEARDNEGFTPFLMAALNGDTLIMQLLFKNGVNIYATNNSDNNALNLTIIADRTDAIKYLLKIGNKWGEKDSEAVNPIKVASKYQRKEIIKLFQENKIPGNIKYEIDQVDITASARLLSHDIYTGVSLSFKEPYLNGGLILGCDFKPWYTRVLLKQSEHAFYQYMQKGSVVYAGLFKDFAITHNPFKPNYEFSASLSAGYSFGNILKGSVYIPENKFLIIPSCSFRWIKRDYSFSLGTQYLKTDFYRVGPIWLKFGASYNLYFDNVRIKAKTLKWY